jgi:hypothetical protein
MVESYALTAADEAALLASMVFPRAVPSKRPNHQHVEVDDSRIFQSSWLRGELPVSPNAYQWVLSLREHNVASLDDFSFVKQVAHGLGLPFVKTPLRFDTKTHETKLQFFLCDGNKNPISIVKFFLLENGTETEISSADVTYELIASSKNKFFKVQYILDITKNPEGKFFLRADAHKVVMSSFPVSGYMVSSSSLQANSAAASTPSHMPFVPPRPHLKFLPASWMRVLDSHGNPHLLNTTTGESVPEIIENSPF